MSSLLGLPVSVAYHLPPCAKCGESVYLSSPPPAGVLEFRRPEESPKPPVYAFIVCVHCKSGYKIRFPAASPAESKEA